jgi:hypothetical protein
MKNKQKEWHHATKHFIKILDQVPLQWLGPDPHSAECLDPDPHSAESLYHYPTFRKNLDQDPKCLKKPGS